MGRLFLPALQRYILFALPFVLFSISLAHNDSSPEIFHWVAVQMNIDYEGKMPEIRFVDKKTLLGLFSEKNHNSYLRWQARYGTLQAQRILKEYLQEIIGLFDRESDTVYVANFLSPCRQQSIVAHEIAHFLQYKTRKLNDRSEQLKLSQRINWEMEAHRIEILFLQLNCQIEINQPLN